MSWLLLASLTAAHAGQIVYEDVGLDDLIAQSTHIVRVRVLTPTWQMRAVPVSTTHDCGTHPVGQYRLSVEELLWTRPGAPTPRPLAHAIEVTTAYAPELHDLARRHCEEGVSKSPIFGRYLQEADVVSGAFLVAFLVWDERFGWSEPIRGAFETANHERWVLRRVKKAS